MKFKTLGEKWYQTVPLDEVLGKDTNAKDVLLVDMGGGSGHDLIGFHKHHPDTPGRLVLQDLLETIQTLNADEMKPVEPMSHNFFTPQPIHGAKAYYLKMVLHDWPDSQVVPILNNLKPALKPGYSKILINEIVIPETNADWFSTSVDILMMVVHSAAERREKQWRALIESAGLKVVKIWSCGSAAEKLIEVKLP
ncbi:O-demethylpuromycin-O-methyltransferase [Dactylellina cionopaga]|nr:O-demethylpuromycin-O-methyltransferase [Dactylellina cionopaga]